MKLLVAIAMFAFVAIQFTQAAPATEDVKKEEPAPVVAADPTSEASAPVVEVKAESSISDVSASPAAETPAPAPASVPAPAPVAAKKP